MYTKRLFIVFLVSLIVSLSFAEETRKSPVSVPSGTTVSPVKFSDEEPAVVLKPEEEVAFLYVYGIWNLESQCLDADMGIGRLATLRELITGVKTAGGETFGLSVNPVKDTNYNYDVMLIGTTCVIRASPRVKGLGAFALVGSPKRILGDFYYNPDGGDLTKAIKLSEMGYSGSGFVRH